MSTGLMITLAGLAVAGFSSLLGMWLERDASKPKKIAFALSFLILLATGVGMVQAMLDAEEQDKMQEDMARMLATLDKIASSSDVAIPELDNLVKSELSAQSRSNPDIVKKMAQRVADEGGDPNAVLGSYLPASEVQEIGRKGGLKVKPPAVAVMSVGKPAEKPRDRERPTLADVASGKASLPGAAPKPVEPPPEASAPPTVAAAPPTAAPDPSADGRRGPQGPGRNAGQAPRAGHEDRPAHQPEGRRRRVQARCRRRRSGRRRRRREGQGRRRRAGQGRRRQSRRRWGEGQGRRRREGQGRRGQEEGRGRQEEGRRRRQEEDPGRFRVLTDRPYGAAASQTNGRTLSHPRSSHSLCRPSPVMTTPQSSPPFPPSLGSP
jgi:hypothetical protein